MVRQSEQFGAAVASVLAEHGLSLRAARNRTGIDHVTLSDMRTGLVPRMETVLKFARGFGLDEAEWLRLADYEPPFDPDRYFMAGLRQLTGRGYRVIIDSEEEPLSWTSREDVEAVLARVREKAGCACPP